MVLISGAVARFLSRLLGLGGGILLTPVLLYAPQVFGLEALLVKEITGLTMTQGLAGAISGLAGTTLSALSPGGWCGTWG